MGLWDKLAKAGLDLTEKGRLGRAVEQGFETAVPRYHGTSKDFDFQKFRDSRHGTWTTENPAEASQYAIENDSMGYRPSTARGAKPWDLEPVNTASRVLPMYAKPLQNPFVVEGDVPDFVRNASNYKKAQSDWFDQLRYLGHDGLLYPGGVRVDFNNANLRSTLAPYAPGNAGKSMIVGGGLFGAMAPGLLREEQ